ncbi:hypothetical protein B4U80_11797 [Leptotrombidium deliense]|uniref:CCHC-type domain-containing protein n=1 Tax=Leptotrombidium deliense TaxID=299467 RepID=A0A443S2A8_9ACAR|nr:hypothetical protein B4U80_11797 [Leptotrombidium deliense]
MAGRGRRITRSNPAPLNIPINYNQIVQALASSLGQINVSNEQVPKFNPAVKEASGWLLLFKSLVVSEVQRLRQFPLCMEGSAANWYTTQLRLLQGRDRSWDEWETAFLAEYELNKGTIYNQLSTRKQREGEDPQQYCNDMITLCSLADPNMHEQQKVNYILGGFQHQMKEKMTLMFPTSVNDLLTKLAVMKSQGITQENNPSSSRMESLLTTLVDRLVSNQGVAIAPANKTQEQFLGQSQAPAMIAEDANVRQLQETVRRLETRLNSMGRGIRYQGRPQKRSCFNCGREGHIQRDCHARRRQNNYSRDNPRRERSTSGGRAQGIDYRPHSPRQFLNRENLHRR